MDNQTLSLFPEKETQKSVFEFLVVVSFPKAINDYVKELKGEFSQRFGSFQSGRSKPHITISKFTLPEKQPDGMIAFLQRSIEEITPFVIAVNGFKSFNRVIYLNVEKSDELNKLKEPFNHLRHGFKTKKYFFIFENPHITIARGLHPDIFEKAEKIYLSKMYINTFLVDKLKVLRRENFGNGTSSRYEHMADLILKGKKKVGPEGLEPPTNRL